MYLHATAELGLAGRYALVCAIEGGMTLKAAAAAFSVSPATVHRWWHRWLAASEEARARLSCLFDCRDRLDVVVVRVPGGVVGHPVDLELQLEPRHARNRLRLRRRPS